MDNGADVAGSVPFGPVDGVPDLELWWKGGVPHGSVVDLIPVEVRVGSHDMLISLLEVKRERRGGIGPPRRGSGFKGR